MSSLEPDDELPSAHPSLIEYITSNYYDRVMKVVIKDGM